MNVDLLIAPAVPIMSPEDTMDKALSLMEESSFTQIPVVADEQYVALVQEDELLDHSETSVALNTNGVLGFKPAIGAAAHPYEALRLMHDMDLSVLPVVDNDQRYLGAITRDTLLRFIAETSGIIVPGGIIVLEIPPRNYTLYEIARICENEDVIITSLQVNTNMAGMLEVTLKLNRTALSAVVSSFERHNYKVKEVYGSELDNADIVDKYNHLMNYINM